MKNKVFVSQKEPCSALMDLQRWSDRKTLRGLRWLLRAVCLDYPELSARVVRDGGMTPGPEEKGRKGKAGKGHKKNKVQRWHLCFKMLVIVFTICNYVGFIAILL